VPLFSISSISIYLGLNRTSELKSYWRLNLLGASVLHFEHLDIWPDLIGHPSKKLLSLEFAPCFCFQFRVSRYITGLNLTTKWKVIVVWIWYKLPFSIWSSSINYGTQLDIRVKSYCHLNFLRASIFNFEHLDILCESIGHPSKNLLSFEFSQCLCFRFRASQ